MATAAKRMQVPTDWLATTTGRVIGFTTLLAAFAGLINGGIDLAKAVLKVPTNVYDKTNDAMFAKHFGKSPLISQPVGVKVSAVSVEMLLQVFDGGDVFVRYGDFQQWLPFQMPKTGAARTSSAFSLISEAQAQSSPTIGKWQRVEQLKVPSVIDLERIKAQSEPPAIATWSKAYIVSKTQDDRNLFKPTQRSYVEVFPADPGFKITKVDVDLGSSNRARVESVNIVDGGKAVKVQYELTSGPLVDQYRGWIHATVKTSQQKVD